MTQAEFDRVSAVLEAAADREVAAKRPGYIQGSDDVLANFKRAGVAAGLTTEQAWAVYAYKHWAAVVSILTRPDLVVSEPPLGRFADLLNYLKLGWAILEERNQQQQTEVSADDRIIRNNARIEELERQIRRGKVVDGPYTNLLPFLAGVGLRPEPAPRDGHDVPGPEPARPQAPNSGNGGAHEGPHQ